MSRWYVLEGTESRQVSFDEGVRSLEIVERKLWLHKQDGIIVSTVFLGLDHGDGKGPPILFETMVFLTKDNDHTDYASERYTSWGDALFGHLRMCRRVFAPDWKKKALLYGPYFDEYDEISDQVDGDRKGPGGDV